jgi:hypothetical protein
LAALSATEEEEDWEETSQLSDTFKLLHKHRADFSVSDTNEDTILHILLKRRVHPDTWSFIFDSEEEISVWDCNKLKTMLRKIVNQGRDSPNSFLDFIRILSNVSTTRLFNG